MADVVSSLRGAGFRLLSTRHEVAIRDCVHYCGFRYARGELNPYEQYARALAKGEPSQARAGLIDFLRHYRPRTFGEALGIELGRDYPLWQFPWKWPLRTPRAWIERPEDVVDVMTHFSPRGIALRCVEREYAWHQHAYARMRDEGYRPNFTSYARVVILQSATRSAYLLTDGNHRASALSALGVSSFHVVARRGATVHRERVESWPLVRLGRMRAEDALAIFDAYHHGNQAPARSEPAPLL